MYVFKGTYYEEPRGRTGALVVQQYLLRQEQRLEEWGYNMRLN